MSQEMRSLEQIVSDLETHGIEFAQALERALQPMAMALMVFSNHPDVAPVIAAYEAQQAELERTTPDPAPTLAARIQRLIDRAETTDSLSSDFVIGAASVIQDEAEALEAQVAALNADVDSILDVRSYVETIYLMAKDGVLLDDENGSIVDLARSVLKQLPRDREFDRTGLLHRLIDLEAERDNKKRMAGYYLQREQEMESRLKREIKRLRAIINDEDMEDPYPDIARQMDEIKRLRSALRAIAFEFMDTPPAQYRMDNQEWREHLEGQYLGDSGFIWRVAVLSLVDQAPKTEDVNEALREEFRNGGK